VLLSGEAGIGKSRLTAALLERLAGEPHTRLRYFCSPLHTDSALYPIIGQMERAAGLGREDIPQAKLDKLDALLAQSSTSAQDTALFAEIAFATERWTLSRARPRPGTAAAKNAGGARCPSQGPDKAKSRPDDLRGCALGRPYKPGSLQSVRGPDSDTSSAADRSVPTRIRAALDRTLLRSPSIGWRSVMLAPSSTDWSDQGRFGEGAQAWRQAWRR
jgi:hypothetical protein